jgi:hypothetical protein
VRHSRRSDGAARACLSAALVLAAEDRERGVIGALVAYPPPNIAALHLDATQRTVIDPKERDKLLTAGAIGLAKVKLVDILGGMATILGGVGSGIATWVGAFELSVGVGFTPSRYCRGRRGHRTSPYRDRNL